MIAISSNCAFTIQLSASPLFIQPREIFRIKTVGLVSLTLLSCARWSFQYRLWLIANYILSPMLLVFVELLLSFSDISTVCRSVTTCHTVLPFWSMDKNNLLYISSVIRNILGYSHKFFNKYSLLQLAVTCQTVLTSRSVDNKNLLLSLSGK
jgi:hypothetical protein